MKHWTIAELKSAKITVRIDYKMGKLKMSTKNLILRPVKINSDDLDVLLAIFEEYGQDR
jgi:hypothetical protein